LKTKVIAEISTFPVGETGTSLSKFVKEAVKEIDKYPNIRVIHHPMGTVLEADSIDIILDVTKVAHKAIINAGAFRVVTQLRIDDRRDKPRKMEDKLKAIEIE
jgi:uncharacterized protein (TIGR00106 family)